MNPAIEQVHATQSAAIKRFWKNHYEGPLMTPAIEKAKAALPDLIAVAEIYRTDRPSSRVDGIIRNAEEALAALDAESAEVDRLQTYTASLRKALISYEHAIVEAEAILGGEYDQHFGPFFDLVCNAREHLTIATSLEAESAGDGCAEVTGLRNSLARLHKAVHTLAQRENGVTLFETDVFRSQKAFEAWTELNHAQKDASVTLGAREPSPLPQPPRAGEDGK
jgi:hypothetical protein